MSGCRKSTSSVPGLNWEIVNSYIQGELNGLDENKNGRSQSPLSIQMKENTSEGHNRTFKLESVSNQSGKKKESSITEKLYIEDAMTELHRLFRQELDDLSNNFEHRITSVVRIGQESRQDNHKMHVQDNNRIETLERKVETQVDTIERNSAYIAHQQNWMNETNRMLDQSTKCANQEVHQHLLTKTVSKNDLVVLETKLSNIENVQKNISDGFEQAREQISTICETLVKHVNETLNNHAANYCHEAFSSMMKNMHTKVEDIVKEKLTGHIFDKIEVSARNIENAYSREAAELCKRVSTLEKDISLMTGDETNMTKMTTHERSVQEYAKHESTRSFAGMDVDIKDEISKIKDQIEAIEIKLDQQSAAIQEKLIVLTTEFSNLGAFLKEEAANNMRETLKQIEISAEAHAKAEYIKLKETLLTHEKKSEILTQTFSTIQRDIGDTICRKEDILMEKINALSIERRLDAIDKRLSDFQNEIQNLHTQEIISVKSDEVALSNEGHQQLGRADRNIDDDSLRSEIDKTNLITSTTQNKSNCERLKANTVRTPHATTTISSISKKGASKPILRDQSNSRFISLEGPLNEDDCDIVEDARKTSIIFPTKR